jgi:uncharacterized protein YceH (UPF0502 family)
MSRHNLTAVESRVLGCLLEKERITPENYPLSLHGLATACNQTSNRDPVVFYDEKTVEAGVNGLREKKLATMIFGAGSRVQKFRHKLLEHYNLDGREVALVCVLLVRGPQTVGELRTRTERMHHFNDLDAVEGCLDGLAKGDAPLVQLLPTRPGQKERRYAQLFSADSLIVEATEPMPVPAIAEAPPARVDDLIKEVASLKAELRELREEFCAFRQQFD